jgi:two-component system response regulator FlrC
MRAQQQWLPGRPVVLVNILIIEDEVLVGEVLADAVTSQGHEVTVATDGEEGLALLQRDRPDAVFLDVQLGELDGIEVLRQIRRRDPGLPVILVTGHAGRKQREEARRLGVTDILDKPFILTHLSETLRSLQT